MLIRSATVVGSKAAKHASCLTGKTKIDTLGSFLNDAFL